MSRLASTDGEDITKGRLDEIPKFIGRQEFVYRRSIGRVGFIGFVLMKVLKDG